MIDKELNYITKVVFLLNHVKNHVYVKNRTNRLGSKVDSSYGINNTPPANMEEFTLTGEQTAHTRPKPMKLNP